MEDETAVQNGTVTTASHEANGHVGDVAVEPRNVPSRPIVQYLTDEEANLAAEEVFQFHRPLLAELAK